MAGRPVGITTRGCRPTSIARGEMDVVSTTVRDVTGATRAHLQRGRGGGARVGPLTVAVVASLNFTSFSGTRLGL